MSIAFVNSATATSGASTVTTLSVSYTPTTGNTVFIGLRANGTFGATPTCVDNNGNAGVQSSSTTNFTLWIMSALSGATSYTIAWSGGTARKASILLGEYSGSITSPSSATSSTNSGASSPGTISVTSTHTNSRIVAMISTGQISTYGSSTGNFRAQSAAGGGNANSIALVDNTAVASGTSITDALTISASTAWEAAAFEIWPAQGSNQLMLVGCGT